MIEANFSKSGYYQIMVQGHLSSSWSGRLGDMEMFLSPQQSTSKQTILQGTITDQAELAGILNSLYELHHALLSVQYLGNKPNSANDFVNMFN
jgi:hypothetical protein